MSSTDYFTLALKIAKMLVLDIVLAMIFATFKILLGRIAAEDFFADTFRTFFTLLYYGFIFSVFQYKRKHHSSES